MIEHYMTKIWRIIGAKDNQDLTTKERQDLITEQLTEMKELVEKSTRANCLKEARKKVAETLVKLG